MHNPKHFPNTFPKILEMASISLHLRHKFSNIQYSIVFLEKLEHSREITVDYFIEVKRKTIVMLKRYSVKVTFFF